MANQFTADQLTENTEIELTGTLQYSVLTRLIEGEELAKVNARRANNGLSAINRPHTTLTLSNPQIVPADPNGLSYNESFIQERFFTSKKHPERGQQYSIESKGTDLPIIALRNQDGTYTQDTSGQELAQGLQVSVTLRVYKPKQYNQRGIALSMIRVEEPVRYYGAGGGNLDLNNLAARGIVFTEPPRAIPGSQATSTGPMPTHEDDGDDYAAQLPQASAGPVGGYPAQSQAQTPAAQPVQQAQPAQQAPAQPAQQAQPAQPASAVSFNPAAAQAPAQQAPAAENAEPTVEQLQEQLRQLQASQNGGSAVTGGWNNQGQAPQPGITLPQG